MAKRKKKSEAQKTTINQRWELSEKARQLSLFPDKSSTHQVPSGNYTIYDDSDVTPFEICVYQFMNKNSNWDSGKTHALSYKKIAIGMNVKHASQIADAVRNLKETGWVKKIGETKKNKPGSQATNLYQIFHHKPFEGEDAPTDRDGRPQKCAITNEIWNKLERGEITWRELHVFYVSKLESNWGDGTLESTLGFLADATRFTRKMVKTCLGNLSGMINKIGKFLYELLPPPSKPKKKRKERDALGRVKLLNGFYYSLNGKWRLQEGTLRLDMKKGHNYWVDGDWYDLMRINKSIYDDFKQLSSMYSDLNELRENLESI